MEGPALQPWLQLHAGPVSSISVLPDSRELLSAGLDGKLFVVSTQVQLSGNFYWWRRPSETGNEWECPQYALLPAIMWHRHQWFGQRCRNGVIQHTKFYLTT